MTEPMPWIEDLWPGTPAPLRSLVLVLHGGRAHGMGSAARKRLSYHRMVPFVRMLHRSGAAQGLGVRIVRYRYRGWNAPHEHPVQDTRWALEQLGKEHPGVPVVLLGHSMGARAAIRAADDPAVTALCLLAPWTQDGDPVRQLAGRSVLIAHGDRERMTDPRLSYRFAVRAKQVTGRVCRFDVHGDGHAMLRRARDWNSLVRRFVEGELGLREPDAEIEDAMRRPTPDGLRVALPTRSERATSR